MSEDLQVVRLVDLVPVFRVGLSPDTPRHLRLEGQRFDSTALVRVNGIQAPSFEVVADNLLDVQIPEVLEGRAIHTIDVFSDHFTGSPRNRLEFLLGSSRTVSGLLKVIQQYVALLLTTPGSDIFHPERGGGLLSLLGSNIDPDTPGTYTGLILTAVDRTVRQTISSQVARRLPAEERLSSVKVLDVGFEKSALALRIQLGFETMIGAQAAAGIVLG